MMLWMRNAILLSVVAVAAAACGADDQGAAHASNDKHTWFEYAYYSSPVTFERDGDDELHAKPLKLQ